MRAKWVLGLLVSMLVACGGSESPSLLDSGDGQMVDDEAMCGPDSPWYECEDVQDELLKGAVAGGWKLPAATRTAGERQHVSYDGAPAWAGGANCSGTFTDGARKLGEYLRQHFATYQIQGYNCRVIAGTNSMSLHGTGRAIDVMVSTDGGQANNQKGDPIGNWLVEHAEEIGIQYVIWDRTQWKAYASGRKDSYYGGVHPHHDHLHVELTVEGSRMQTPWFKQRGFAEAPDMSADFLAGPLQGDASRANFRLDNDSSEPFDNVTIGYDAPAHLRLTKYVVYRQAPKASTWDVQEEGVPNENAGKVNLGRLAPGAAKRLVLHAEGRGDRQTGTVKGWVQHIDKYYKGATAFETAPTVNELGARLRGSAALTVPAQVPRPAQLVVCGGVASYRIPAPPAGVTALQAKKLARLHCAFFDGAPTADNMAGWYESLADGMLIPGVAEGMWTRPRFARPAWKSLGNRDFVRDVYAVLLGTTPTAAEMDAAVADLQAGVHRARVANQVVQSAPYAALTEPIWR